MEFFCYNQCPKLANYNILINARQAMVNWIEQLFVMLAHPDMIPPTSKCFLSSQVKGSRIEMQPFLLKLLDEAFPSRIKKSSLGIGPT